MGCHRQNWKYGEHAREIPNLNLYAIGSINKMP